MTGGGRGGTGRGGARVESGQEQLALGAELGLVKCQGEGKHGAGTEIV